MPWVPCRLREIFLGGTCLQMQGTEVVGWAASGSHQVVFVGGRALMSHLKANVRLRKISLRMAGRYRGELFEEVWALEKVSGEQEAAERAAVQG